MQDSCSHLLRSILNYGIIFETVFRHLLQVGISITRDVTPFLRKRGSQNKFAAYVLRRPSGYNWQMTADDLSRSPRLHNISSVICRLKLLLRVGTPPPPHTHKHCHVFLFFFRRICHFMWRPLCNSQRHLVTKGNNMASIQTYDRMNAITSTSARAAVIL
jgi:hypothetical protein